MTDSRPSGEIYRRRYACQCGRRWTTHETRVEDGTQVPGVPGVVARVTDVLLGLVKEINA